MANKIRILKETILMAINLTKNQGINLTKDVEGVEEALKTIKLGCGWQASDSGYVTITRTVTKTRRTGGFLGFGGTIETYEEPATEEVYVGNIDVDASVFAFKNGTLVGECTFRNQTMKNRVGKTVAKSSGDDTVGSRGKNKSDNETVTINLENAVGFADTLYLALNIFQAKNKGQHFNMINNSYVRVYDDKGIELAYFNLAEDYDKKTGIVVGKLAERNGEFEFVALGDGVIVSDLRDLASKSKRY